MREQEWGWFVSCVDVTFAQVIPLRSLSIPGVHRGLLSLEEKKTIILQEFSSVSLDTMGPLYIYSLIKRAEFYLNKLSVSVQSLSLVWLYDPMDCSMAGFPLHHQLLELAHTRVHPVGDAIQPSHPLLSPSLPAFNLSQHQCLFEGISSSYQVARVLELQLQYQSLQYSGLISFRIDCFDLLAVQGTSLLQQHSSKTWVLRRSAFFILQLSHPYVTAGNTTALTRQTFVSKVMSLLFHMLSRLVIAFLPRSKHLLLSWLHSPSAVILEPKKRKVCHCFHCFPIYLPWSDGTRCHDLSFLNVGF